VIGAHEPHEATPREESRSILFAVDFDSTWTADPALFRMLVAIGQARGHRFVLVTGRSDEGQWGAVVRREIRDLMPIVFAANGWKREAAERAGFKVDIWIDDHPEAVAKQTLLMVAGKDGAT
jgi:hypothetical protein